MFRSITGKLKKAIISTYESCSCLGRTRYENEEWLNIKTGVKQGSVIFTLLFIAYMDSIFKKYKSNMCSFEDGDMILYGDDITCCSDNRGYFERSLICWKRCFDEVGLHTYV